MTTESLTGILYLLLRHGQCFLVYPAAFLPRPRAVTRPAELGLAYSNLQLRTSDGTVLRCYLLRHADQSESDIRRMDHKDGIQMDWDTRIPRQKDFSLPAVATVIIFHGNAMNSGDMILHAKRFLVLRCNVLMLSYRGYGDSEGTPSEKGLRLDAQAALDHVKADPELSQTPIILYGISLGGAVAIDLACRNPSKISALIVENTFQSIPHVVHDWAYIGRLSFLCTQRWNSAAKMCLIPPCTPLLMLSGGRDQVVPQKNMRALWEIARTRRGPKSSKGRREPVSVSDKDRFEEFRYGTHENTFACTGYWPKVGDFIASVTTSGG
ncbi:Alpha/Beta hydrolase protein [Mycena sp. CBHHK59/15]|nr:Alpha/Beta hydrolase protein [Mycena sp. CBHHK59/15]